MTDFSGVEPPPHVEALLQYQINILSWLHAELAFNHTALVSQLQTMLNTMVGGQGGGIDAVKAQALKQRAIRLAKLRAAQLEIGP